MKKVTKWVSIILALILCIGVFPMAALADGEGGDTGSDVWADGKIKLEIGWIDPNAHRDSMQRKGSSLSWSYLPYYTGFLVELYDSNGDLVATNNSEARHTFTGLKAGVYTIRLTMMDTGR